LDGWISVKVEVSSPERRVMSVISQRPGSGSGSALEPSDRAAVAEQAPVDLLGEVGHPVPVVLARVGVVADLEVVLLAVVAGGAASVAATREATARELVDLVGLVDVFLVEALGRRVRGEVRA
jgi:hypothetical protein